MKILKQIRDQRSGLKWIWQLPWDPSPTPSNTRQGAPIEDTNTSAIHINDPIVTGGYNMPVSFSHHSDTKQKPRNLLDYDLATDRYQQ